MRGFVPVFASLCAPFAFVAACDEAPDAGTTEGSASEFESESESESEFEFEFEFVPQPLGAGALAKHAFTRDDAPVQAAVDPVALPDDALPYLMSRFGPSQGAAGTHVRILTAFDPSGCSGTGACAVTIGGYAVPIASDLHLLEIVVPRGTATGPLCVTWQGRTECGETFTMLIAPLIYESAPGHVLAGAGDTTIALAGDGFMVDSEVFFDAMPVATTVHSAYAITAVVPASALATAGIHTVTVYSPSSGRCGAESQAEDFIVD